MDKTQRHFYGQVAPHLPSGRGRYLLSEKLSYGTLIE